MKKDSKPSSFNGMAVASLVTGVASLAIIPPFIFGFLALVFGEIDIIKTRRLGVRIHRMTLAGIVLGTIGLVLGIVLRIWL